MTLTTGVIPLPAVIKPNHASGLGEFLYTAEDVETLKCNDPCAEWLSIDHARYNREWAYSQVARKVVIEIPRNGSCSGAYRKPGCGAQGQSLG